MLVDIKRADAIVTAAKGAVSASVKSTGQIDADFLGPRRAWGWTLSQLAEQLDHSVGWLSQVERDTSEPALDDVRTGALLFLSSISFLFSQSPDTLERRYIARADHRRELNDDSKGLFESLLSPDLCGAFELVHLAFAVGAKCPQPFVRPTEEAGYDIDGSLTLIIDGKEFGLNTGDSFRFAVEREA